MIRILLVDDHKIIRDGLKALLFGEDDLEIIGECSDGEEVLDFVDREQVDVILMDINLGEDTLDGIQTMNKIREMPACKGIKVFAITSYAIPDDKDRFLNLGFDKYFAKPYDENRLISAIEE